MGIAAGVVFGDGAQFGVGAEEQVDWRRRPFDLAALAVAPLVQSRIGRLGPDGRHVEQIDEKVVRQRAGTAGEHAVPGTAGVGVEGA
ncbi:hypothetical protein SDC9_197736 [bioreactor metagenome]|uniref:Uncharacterized protein n=1 Tax=bioreactor metagenome TaxID=1076179 RepID=A0A645IG72_9ZZZZ